MIEILIQIEQKIVIKIWSFEKYLKISQLCFSL